MPMSSMKGLALIRIGLGSYFLADAWRKTTTGWFDNGDQLTSFVQSHVDDAPPAYTRFLTDIVGANVDVWATLVTLGEWAVGISLTLGLLTRLGAITGMWLMLNFMMAKGLPNIDGSIDRLFFLVLLVFTVTPAGLVWAIDGLIGPRMESTALGRWVTGGFSPSLAAVDYPDRAHRRASRAA